MEDSFRVRVDKAFGYLDSSSSRTPAFSSSLWSLSDEEIERRGSSRQKDSSDDEDESKPCPSNLDGFFAKQQIVPSPDEPVDLRKQLEGDLKDLNDYDDNDDDEEEDGRNDENRPVGSSSRYFVKSEGNEDDEWEIRSSIGLDCTLDYEEEEDEYDKVAIGREKASERLYMKDTYGYGADDCIFTKEINDYGVDLIPQNELPKTPRDFTRDPRANHMAAKLRLKEDAEAAGSFDLMLGAHANVTPVVAVGTPISTMEEDVANKPKPILKRKEKKVDSKSSHKRVRFNPVCINGSEDDPEGAKVVGEASSMDDSEVAESASFVNQHSSAVPDYIRNPSKYTHYIFDSSSDDIDEEANKKAYMDFLNVVKRSNTPESQLPDDVPVDLPRSVMFTPKKKAGADVSTVRFGNAFKVDARKDLMPRTVGIAAEVAGESEVCAMEEDEPETASPAAAANMTTSNLLKPGRRYRTKCGGDLEGSTE